MKLTEIFKDWNEPAISCLVDQTQVQKPILVVATDKIPDHIKSRE